MGSDLIYKVLQLKERLWFKPLVFCLGAILAMQVAHIGNRFPRPEILSVITDETVEILLKIIASSMLAVATFAVGSLVSAYSSASAQATPRAFQLLIADDTSQNALSSFIGAFIFSIVALVALRLDFYRDGGIVTLFALTMMIFIWVVLTFVAWTDNIARLGRLRTIIQKTEDATADMLKKRRDAPHLGGVGLTKDNALHGQQIFPQDIGYLRHVALDGLQTIAEDNNMKIILNGLPGTFARPDRALVTISKDKIDDKLAQEIRDQFNIGTERSIAEDPRFGVLILSEIAIRALSPAVNDPGTAIVIVGRMVRLFTLWTSPKESETEDGQDYDRIIVSPLNIDDLFDDAFRAISRDGSGIVEVMIALQKAQVSLAHVNDGVYRDAATRMARHIMARSETAMAHDFDIDAVRQAGSSLLD